MFSIIVVFGNVLARRENCVLLILLDTTYQAQVEPANTNT
jgi:hypothetical protein